MDDESGGLCISFPAKISDMTPCRPDTFQLLQEQDLTSVTIHGDRIRLCSIHPDFAQPIFEHFTPEITRFMIPKPADRIEETLEFIRCAIRGMKNRNDLTFVILDRERNEFLGCCGIHGRGRPETPELGIWLRKSAHGCGLGREAIMLACRWALDHLHFDCLLYPVDRANTPSRRIPEALGGVISEERKEKTMSGNVLEEVIYRITPEAIAAHHAQTIYDGLKKRSLPLFREEKCEVDPLITDPTDQRRGLTLRIRPDTSILAKLDAFIDEVKGIAPDQYYPSAADLHLTALSIISCHAGFSIDTQKARPYIELINAAVQQISPPLLHFKGFTASPSCLLLQGFAGNRELDRLRNLLRNAFKVSGLPHTIDARYPARAAHVTVMRFQQPQMHAYRLADWIEQHSEDAFGIQKVHELELVHNDWYHRASCTTVLHTFTLN